MQGGSNYKGLDTGQNIFLYFLQIKFHLKSQADQSLQQKLNLIKNN